MKTCELTTAVTALANAIACGLSETELALTAAIFVQIGDTLATIAAQRVIYEAKEQKSGITNSLD